MVDHWYSCLFHFSKTFFRLFHHTLFQNKCGLGEDVEISEGTEDVSLPPFFWDPTNLPDRRRATARKTDVFRHAGFGLFRSNEHSSNSIMLIKWTSWQPQVSIKNWQLYQRVNSHTHVVIYDWHEDQHRPIWECFLFWCRPFPQAASTVTLQFGFPEFTWPSLFFPHLIYWLGRTWVK